MSSTGEWGTKAFEELQKDITMNTDLYYMITTDNTKYVIVYLYCLNRTSPVIVVMVFLFYIWLFIQDAKAWFCGPAEPFVSLFWNILWEKKK